MLDTFQIVCCLVLAISYGVLLRQGRGRELGWLALSAWMGEASCIQAYHFYGYAPAWWLRLAGVPVLVPLIWPVVVLSARDVARALWPSLGGWRLAGAAALGVLLDASLIEIVAVHAGLWSWSEPGYFGVPWIGLLGWAWFAFFAVAALEAGWSAIWAAPATHLGIQASWWLLLRWGLREELGLPALYVFLVGMAGLCLLIARAPGRLPWSVAGPRIPAALVFFGLLPGAPWPLWAHAGGLAVPYLLAMQYVRRKAA